MSAEERARIETAIRECSTFNRPLVLADPETGEDLDVWAWTLEILGVERGEDHGTILGQVLGQLVPDLIRAGREDDVPDWLLYIRETVPTLYPSPESLFQ
jgi:hypothetical protein